MQSSLSPSEGRRTLNIQSVPKSSPSPVGADDLRKLMLKEGYTRDELEGLYTHKVRGRLPRSAF